MKPQLTISLLASKQMHAVRKCLDSLVPILMQIPSELIVVDTSENDCIRELVLQYTPHVIPFRWCNDFSKARNAGLELAQGEWFMFIDDDEWFEDPSEIIEFFSSGEYLQYNCARYIVRNYLNWVGTNYIDAHLNRMIRITSETKFKNPIHEYLSPLREPSKTFSAFAHHYGYAGKIQMTKPERNIPLIKKELREHKPTVHNYTQLAQEYIASHEFETAEKYVRKCLELEVPQLDLEVSWCVAYLPYIIRVQKDYQRAWEIGKEMLRHSQCTELASLRIYSDLIETGGHLINHEKDIIIYTKAYYQYLNRMDARPEQWSKQSIGTLGEQHVKTSKDILYFMGFKAAVHEEDIQSALFFIGLLPWENGDAERLYPHFCNMLRDEKKENFLLNVFEELEGNDPLILIIKSRSAWKKGKRQESEKYLNLAAESRQIYVLMEAALLAFQSQGKLSLQPILSHADISQWNDISIYVTENEESDHVSHWISLAKSYLSNYPIPVLSLLISFQELLLIQGVLEIEDEDLFQEIKQYCQWVKDYTTCFYNEQVLFSDNTNFLPPNYRFALQMDQVFQDLENSDFPQVLKRLREAINTYNPLCGVIRRVLSIIAEEINHPEPTSPEFLALAGQVKQTVQYLIQEGRYEESLPLVQQLSSLLPKDLEVVRLRQELWSHMGD